MAVNWIAAADKFRNTFKKEFKETMIVWILTSGKYTISSGDTPSTKVEYDTNGPIKSFQVDDFGVVNPEEVEILFHSGNPRGQHPGFNGPEKYRN